MWPFRKKQPLVIGNYYKLKGDPWGPELVIKDLRQGWVRYAFMSELGETHMVSLEEKVFRKLYEFA